jgi:thioredoxin reductase (NADPH)
MAVVIVVGDGPGGLSAALFLAKNGHEVRVYGTDRTAMHYAHLHNYLGLPDTPGSTIQEIGRAQATAFGARLVEEAVTRASASPDGVEIATETGSSATGDYLVLSEGKNPVLARALGLEETPDGAIAVDRECRSSDDRVYVVGRSARPTRSQAIISAGDGAKAALDILAREAGEDVQDWDTPPKDD